MMCDVVIKNNHAQSHQPTWCSVELNVSIYQPTCIGKMWHKVNFQVEVLNSEFSFPPLDWLPNQD